jgi:hypothetical protein
VAEPASSGDRHARRGRRGSAHDGSRLVVEPAHRAGVGEEEPVEGFVDERIGVVDQFLHVSGPCSRRPW